MFEHRKDPLASRPKFRQRLLRCMAMGLGLVAISLAIGIVGYHLSEGLGWLDALVNASMILSGMGPVNELHHDAGKWFASFYALFSGVAFITSVGIIFAPVVHRLLHSFHVETPSK